MRVLPMSIARPALAAVCILALTACGEKDAAPRVAGGDATVGKKLVEQYQCGSCHAIPDIPASRGTAGPALEGFGRRSYIAGRFPNNADALTRWLANPPAMKPGTLMPDLGVSPDDARHMAAFLYTLR